MDESVCLLIKLYLIKLFDISLQWRYNERNSVSNHRRLDFLHVRCIHQWPVNFPHKVPEARNGGSQDMNE